MILAMSMTSLGNTGKGLLCGNNVEKDCLMLRVTYFAREYFYPHGGSTHAQEFFSSLKEREDVSFAEVVPKECNPPRIKGIHNNKSWIKHVLNFVMALRATLSPWIRHVDELRKSVSDSKSNVLIVRAGHNLPMVGLLKKKLPDTRIVAEVNAAIFDETFPNIWFKKMWQNYEAKKIGQADGVTVVSSYLKHYLTERGVPEHKILVNQNGVNPLLFRTQSNQDREKVRREFGVPEGAFVVGYVGGMESFRRIAKIVEKVADLRRSGVDDLFLLLVGDGHDMPDVQHALDDNSDVMSGWSWCEGRKPYVRMPEIMAIFDLAIFPFSNLYGSPIKLFEYMAMGLPVIGPDVPAVNEVFADGTHLLMADQSGSNFSDLVMELKGNSARRQALATAGQQFVLETYTWQKNAERVVDYVQQLT